jgi:Cft2 family RNA processing exonuclease
MKLNFGVKENGTVILGSKVACDGMIDEKMETLVFSHAHRDHLEHSYIANAYTLDKSVVMTEETRLLAATYGNTNLETNFHLQTVNPQEALNFNDYSVELFEAKHILGSVQILVDYKKEGKFLYSGDFGAEVINIPESDFLVIDSTYSEMFSKNSWSQESAFNELRQEINSVIQESPVFIVGDPGVLEIALHELAFWDKIPKIISRDKEKKWANIYKSKNFDLPVVLSEESDEEEVRSLKFENYIQTAHNRKNIGDNPGGKVFVLKNFGIDRHEPINKINTNQYLVGLSSHAYGESLFKYIEKVNPSVIVTDYFRGKNNAKTLATSIEKEMGIKTYSSTEVEIT